MEKFYIKVHSLIDVITNSSTEIFMIDTEKTLEIIQQIIREKESEFPCEYGDYFSNVNVADDWDISEAFGYLDEEEAVKFLKAKGYKVEKIGNTEDSTNYISISNERGYMSEGLKNFINETFNVVHHDN